MNDNAATSEQVVLFADLLGFAALTEQHEIDRRAIMTYHRPFGWALDELLAAHQDPLARVFGAFHRSLRWTLDAATLRHPLTAITFSDSAFIAAERLGDVVAIAIDLVKSLLPQRVPLRMGIAHGSFAALRFRSDVTEGSGDHAAHFLGRGVVRAHATEACGIKGIRVLLHPSAAMLVDDPAHRQSGHRPRTIGVVRCGEGETDNPAGVEREINYWDFGVTDETAAWHALQDMWTAAPTPAKNHYLFTAEAVNRMRVASGAPPLLDLRRRTLPRTRKSSAP